MVNRILKVFYFMLLIIILTSCGNEKNIIPNTPELGTIETTSNYIIKEGEVSPQMPQEEFRSVTLNEKYAKLIKNDYGLETMYDCPYTKAGENVFFKEIYGYHKNIMIHMHEDATGWELKKGDILKFEFSTTTEAAQYHFLIGLIKDKKVNENRIVEKNVCNEEFEIKKTGTYFFFISNIDNNDVMLQNVSILKKM